MITLSTSAFWASLLAAWILGMLVSAAIDVCIEMHMAKWRAKRANKITKESNERIAEMQNGKMDELHAVNVELQHLMKEGE